ncbi:MAG TPA: tripartite tricarboxylate transporter substrate binding protein, partial [Burkholderiales bacterium]
MLKVHLVASMTAVGATFIGTIPGYAQNYPSKPIRIVTDATGGSPDFVARIIAQGISGALGQSVIVDNRPSGSIP